MRERFTIIGVLAFVAVLIPSLLTIRRYYYDPAEFEVEQIHPFYENTESTVIDPGEYFDIKVLNHMGNEIEVEDIEVSLNKKEGRQYLSLKCGDVTYETEAEVIPVTSVSVSYDGKVYEGGTPDRSKFSAYAIYEDGTEKEAQILSMDSLKEIYSPAVIHIHTGYGDGEITIEPVMCTGIHAEYSENVYEGDILKHDGFTVDALYEDGESEQIKDYSVQADEEKIREETDVEVKHGKFTDRVHITPAKVVSAHPEMARVLKTGEPLSIKSVTLVYEDGTVKTIPKKDIEFTTDITTPAIDGDNQYRFVYHDILYSFTVTAKQSTNVEDAVRYFTDEVEESDYHHITDSIFVTIRHYENELCSYYLSHVVINDPSQLRSELSNGSYGGTREKPTEASKRLNWVIGINGSNFDYGTGQPVYAGAVIKNRIVMEGNATNGMEICLMSNGVLFSPEPGVDPARLVASDVTDSWSCGDTLLVNDGKPVNVGIQSEQYRYPRTAIGMVQPCEYYMITAGEGNYSKGMTYDEVRDVLLSHGCSFGKCMDGGGSSSLVFENELINTPAVNDSERAVCDFLYFVEQEE